MIDRDGQASALKRLVTGDPPETIVSAVCYLFGVDRWKLDKIFNFSSR